MADHDYFTKEINKAFRHEHIAQGDSVDAKTAGRLFDDVMNQLSQPGHKVSAANGREVARELRNALKDYGVEDLIFVDSGKNGTKNDVVDKFDKLQVKVDVWGPNSFEDVPVHEAISSRELFTHKKYTAAEYKQAEPLTLQMWNYLGPKRDNLQQLQDEMCSHSDYWGKRMDDNAGRKVRDVAVQNLCDWANDNQNKYVFRPSTNSQHCDGFEVTDRSTGKKAFIRLPDAEAHGQFLNTKLQWK